MRSTQDALDETGAVNNYEPSGERFSQPPIIDSSPRFEPKPFERETRTPDIYDTGEKYVPTRDYAPPIQTDDQILTSSSTMRFDPKPFERETRTPIYEPTRDYAPPIQTDAQILTSSSTMQTTAAAASPAIVPTLPAKKITKIKRAATGAIKTPLLVGSTRRIEKLEAAAVADDDLIFGYPSTYVYIAGGVAALGLMYIFSGKK